MFIGAFIDLNRVIVLCTRFTDEIFSFLISLIFIINAIGSPFSDVGVVHYFDMNHKSHGPYEDQPYYSHWASALLSLIIFIGTTQGTQASSCPHALAPSRVQHSHDIHSSFLLLSGIFTPQVQVLPVLTQPSLEEHNDRLRCSDLNFDLVIDWKFFCRHSHRETKRAQQIRADLSML